VINKYNPDATTSVDEVSLQVGDEEAMLIPSAMPNAIKIRETAEATKAPATTGVH
jgi:hypothetical protein